MKMVMKGRHGYTKEGHHHHACPFCRAMEKDLVRTKPEKLKK